MEHSREVHVVGMVHHETTTGLLNPVHEVAEIVDNQNRGAHACLVFANHEMTEHTAAACVQAFRTFAANVHGGTVEQADGQFGIAGTVAGVTRAFPGI